MERNRALVGAPLGERLEVDAICRPGVGRGVRAESGFGDRGLKGLVAVSIWSANHTGMIARTGTSVNIIPS